MKAHSLQTFVRSIMPFLSKGEGRSSLNQVQPIATTSSARVRASSASEINSSSLFARLGRLRAKSADSASPEPRVSGNTAAPGTFDFLNQTQVQKPSSPESREALNNLSEGFNALVEQYGHPIDWDSSTNRNAVAEGSALLNQYQSALQGINPHQDFEVATKAVFEAGSIMTGLRSGSHFVRVPHLFTDGLNVNSYFTAKSAMQFALKNMHDYPLIYKNSHKAMCYDALAKVMDEDEHVSINGWKCSRDGIENALAKTNVGLPDPYSIAPAPRVSTSEKIKGLIGRTRSGTV
ncbi:MAG: hypothetical protein VX185_06165 [Pseudomonadota bacterium]|nr:hypothetical protein [Pseudomonadota bacterium]